MNTRDAVNRAIADMPVRVPFDMTENDWMPHVAWQAGYMDALNMVMFWAKGLEEASPERAEQLRVAAQAVLDRPLILKRDEAVIAICRQNDFLSRVNP